MKSRDTAGAAQSGYLLEYGRRKIRVCADTFQNLAQIFGEDEDCLLYTSRRCCLAGPWIPASSMGR